MTEAVYLVSSVLLIYLTLASIYQIYSQEHYIFSFIGLAENGLDVKDITHVVGTHGHLDHIGNLNLFPEATFIVSHDIYKDDLFVNHDFDKVFATVLLSSLLVETINLSLFLYLQKIEICMSLKL